MRRSNTSRRTNRAEVPRRSAAWSTDSSVSNSGWPPSACGGSCSNGSGCGGQLLPGNPSLFAGTSRCRQGQPALPLGRVPDPDPDPGGDDNHGLVVLGSPPSIEGDAIAGPSPLGKRDPS